MVQSPNYKKTVLSLGTIGAKLMNVTIKWFDSYRINIYS